MKHQYVGDVNDYLKYSLLRALAATGEPLLVVWMLTGADTRTDGRRTSYLQDPHTYRGVDPELFDALESMVRTGDRCLGAVERSPILPTAHFVSSEVPADDLKRRLFMEAALQRAQPGSMIFFDPDNGLEVASVRPGRKNSDKYLFWSEAEGAYSRGHSLIVYQHFPRRSRSAFLEELGMKVGERCRCATTIALTTPHVAFLILPQPSVDRRLMGQLQDLVERTSVFRTRLTRTTASALASGVIS